MSLNTKLGQISESSHYQTDIASELLVFPPAKYHIVAHSSHIARNISLAVKGISTRKTDMLDASMHTTVLRSISTIIAVHSFIQNSIMALHQGNYSEEPPTPVRINRQVLKSSRNVSVYII